MKSMKRQDLVQMLDEGEFLTLLAEAKIPDESKLTILNDHSEWKRQQILSGKPYRTEVITVKGKKIAVGEIFRCPLTGRIRMNTGR